MKKILFCFLLMGGIVAFTSAQKTVLVVQPVETVVVQTQETCTPIPVTNLSISFKTGANYYTMPPSEIIQYDKLNLMFGGTVDYTINPLIGIGLEYNYNDYSRPYIYNHVKGLLIGGTHDVMLYGSVNLSNAFSPYRIGFWRSLNVYGNVGGGFAFYHFRYSYAADNSTDAAMAGQLGLNAEFTMNEYINLCFEGQYRQYDALYMSGIKSNRNVDALMLSVGVRFKILSDKVKHARNINLCEYTPKPVPVIINKIVQGDTDETLARLRVIEQENKDLKVNMQKIRDDARNASIQKDLLSQNAALNQKIKDDSKDNSVQNALISQNAALAQKLQKMEADLKLLATKKQGVVNASFESIEFQFGSRELTPASAQIMDQIASILINNSFWTGLKISGHTDNIGTDAFNQKLSEERAFAVKEYLLAKGVPSSNVVAIGWGESKPVDTNSTPEGRQNNRRVEFEMSK